LTFVGNKEMNDNDEVDWW